MRRYLPLILAFAFVAHADEVLDNAAIMRLVQAGLSTDIIMIKIDRTPTRFDMSTDALIALKAANVPDSVIKAMLLKLPAAATPPAQATNRCINVTYYNLGPNGWAWIPSSLCVTPTEISVDDQTIKGEAVAAQCFVKALSLGRADAEWWFTDRHESFKFRGKENELDEIAALVVRAAPSSRRGSCNDRSIAPLFPK